jgi:hypothetical protein
VFGAFGHLLTRSVTDMAAKVLAEKRVRAGFERGLLHYYP